MSESSGAAAIGFEGPGYGLVSLAVLVASLWRYWLPTRYRLDGQGVWVAHLGWERLHPWGQFRRAEVHRDGIFLSPFPRASRLDAFRGFFLRFGGCRGEVVSFVREHVAPGPV